MTTASRRATVAAATAKWRERHRDEDRGRNRQRMRAIRAAAKLAVCAVSDAEMDDRARARWNPAWGACS